VTQTLHLPHSYALGSPEPEPPPRRTWTPMLLTQLLVILAVLVAGVTGAALRGKDDGKDVLSVVQAASTTAAAQKTMRATYEFRLSGSGLDVKSGGSMLTDLARKVAAGTVSSPGIGEIEVRSVDGVSYMQLPGDRTDAAGHHWVAYRVMKPGAVVGAQDPLTMLKLISDAKGVEDVGDAKVNGVETTHYRVHIDPARFEDAVADSGTNITIPPGTFDQLKDAVSEVWIDDDNLPRRMAMSFQIQQAKMSMRFDFLDYGEPVDVTAPDSSDVTEVGSPLELGRLLSGITTG
jgi:hypothetical protein